MLYTQPLPCLPASPPLSLSLSLSVQVLKAWETVAGGGGKPLTAEDLRRVLVKQGAKFSALIFVQIFLDLGAAYGAYVGGKQHWLAGCSSCPVL